MGPSIGVPAQTQSALHPVYGHFPVFTVLFPFVYTSSVGYWLDQSSPIRTQAKETGVLATGMYVHTYMCAYKMFVAVLLNVFCDETI